MVANGPKLSICVPSRNRQHYFQKTIEGLMRRARGDVQFVFADNSDDPSVMNGYMATLKDDPRVVYLPSMDRALSKVDNWERTLEAATGEWVTLIGDDDFIDPALPDALDRIIAANPEIEAFSWGVANFTWPSDVTPIHNIFVPYESIVVKVPVTEPQKRMFGWSGANMVPTSGYSIYHSAIRRPLLDRIKAQFGGRYFEHPVVDIDIAMKVIAVGKDFAFCQRIMSVMGSCPDSNSFAIGRRDFAAKRAESDREERLGGLDPEAFMEDLPFKSELGASATVLAAQQWFKSAYGADSQGWEENFVKACALNVQAYHDREAFDVVKAGYEAAIGRWQDGKYLKFFEPVFQPVELRPMLILTGSQEEGILIRSDIADAQAPEDLYGVIDALCTPLDMIDIPEEGLRYPWEQFMHSVNGPSRPIQIEQRRVA